MSDNVLGFPHGRRPGDYLPCDVEPPCESLPVSNLEWIQDGDGCLQPKGEYKPWTRTDFLAEANHLITKDRDEMYGPAAVNLTNMSILLDAFERICRPDYPIAAKTALRMALVKIARTQTGIHCPDNYTDGVGYLALAGEECEKVR